jgi:hypothetical protein
VQRRRHIGETLTIQDVPEQTTDFTEQYMISNGKDRLRKTLWLRSQARAIGSQLSLPQSNNPDLQELWFADFARRSEFERVIRDLVGAQSAQQRT